MNIGYACQVIGVLDTNQRGCVMKNCKEEKLTEVILANLEALDHIITYNIQNQIKLFRISSDLIPFGSSEINTIPWWKSFGPELQAIGNRAKNAGIRLSLHPGQYTVINSPHEEVVKRAVEDLKYHAKILDAMGMSLECKLILHIGGVYGDKEAAIKRFEQRYQILPENVKNRLVIENDDKNYNIAEVLRIGQALQIPVIFDNLHHELNPPMDSVSELIWIKKCMETWKKSDGRPKLHYSQQDEKKRRGSHSRTIKLKTFLSFYEPIKTFDLDIMLEVKDKNLSAIKCCNAIAVCNQNKKLEIEWSKYKYTVLEHSHKNYLSIRQLLKEQNNYPVVLFYELIEASLEMNVENGAAVNAADHIWGYFKKMATEKEKKQYFDKMKLFEEGKLPLSCVKHYLWKLTLNYQETYLLASYYFYLD